MNTESTNTTESTNPLVNEVKAFIASKPVVIYMKGTPEFPACGFSARACEVLATAGVQRSDVAAFDILTNRPMFDALREYSKWPTSPQIFIGGQFIGGCDIVVELYQNGELEEILKEKKVI